MFSFIAISAMFRGEVHSVHYGDSSSGLMEGGQKREFDPRIEQRTIWNRIDRKISIPRPIATEYEIFDSDRGKA